MNMCEMLELVHTHPILRDIDMNQQWGVPVFDLHNGKLLVKFFPHREQFSEGRILIYAPSYQIEFVYPFKRLQFFCCFQGGDYSSQKPMLYMDAEVYFQKNAEHETSLFCIGDELLSAVTADGSVPKDALEKYRASASSWMEATQTLPIYREEA